LETLNIKARTIEAQMDLLYWQIDDEHEEKKIVDVDKEFMNS